MIKKAGLGCLGIILISFVVAILSQGTPQSASPQATSLSAPQATASDEKAIQSSSLQKDVEVPKSTATAIPPQSPTPPPKRYGTKENPVPSGAYYTMEDRGAKLQVRVIETVKDASSLAKAANLFNEDPPANQDYLLVKLEARYIKGPTDVPYSTNAGGNRFLAQNRLWGAPMISIAPEPQFVGNDIFPGAIVEGWLPGKYLPKDAMDGAVLEYQGVYFSLGAPSPAAADQRPEPLPTPDPAQVASAPLGSRFNPIPLGKAVPFNDHGNKIAMAITQVVVNADQEIKEANMFNSDAPNGYQYILVAARLDLLEASGSEPYHTTDDIRFYAANRLWGGGGVIVSPEPEFGGQDIFPGASVEGWMGARVIPSDLADSATLSYKGVYFALK